MDLAHSADPVNPAPLHWEADVVLRDGNTAHLRPITPQDADALQKFHLGQSERSTYFRFFGPKPRLTDEDLHKFTHVDYKDRVALVAVITELDESGEPTERIIGVARYDRVNSKQAEVAFNISDAHHGRGLGSVMLEHLAAAARENGIARFTAEVLPRNGQMLNVFVEAGYDVRRKHDDGVILLGFDIDPTERSRQVAQDREHASESRSMQQLMAPRSILVIGPENPQTQPQLQARAQSVLTGSASVTGGPALHVWGTDLDLPDGVNQVTDLGPLHQEKLNIDLAVVARPAEEILAVIEALSGLNVRGLLLLSGGFAETGEAGVALQRKVIRAAHRAGMRIVGPASYGMLSTAPEAPFDATLANWNTRAGNIGVFCQSAQIAATIQHSVQLRGLGLSTLVSAGNRADVSGNDVMQLWQTDSRTEVACLYLESIGNPRKFSRIARKLAQTKPVVVATAGRSGHTAPAGHVVKTSQAPKRTLNEILRRAGVIHAQSIRQMMDVAQALSAQPLPRGKRCLIIANTPSLLSLVAEAAADAGLAINEHSCSLDPLGLSPAQLRTEITRLLNTEQIDSLLIADIPVDQQQTSQLVLQAAHAAAGTRITTLACLTATRGLVPEYTVPDPQGEDFTVPMYSTPEDAATVLGMISSYAQNHTADRGQVALHDDLDRVKAQQILANYDLTETTQLPVEVAAELLACYGIEVWLSQDVADADDAAAKAKALGYPIALKSSDPLLRHRADLGGVRLNISDEEELRNDFAEMHTQLVTGYGSSHPFQIQRMAPAGVACVLRAVEDPLFGPVISFGLAGDAIELLGDVSHGIPPLTFGDVQDMITSVKAAPKLFGYKGLPQFYVPALEDLLARVSALAFELPQVQQIELYPIVVAEHGAAVLSGAVSIGKSSRNVAPRRALPG